MVIPLSLLISNKIFNISCEVVESRVPVGSSARISLRFVINARAIAFFYLFF
jgi:hypothetical protein